MKYYVLNVLLFRNNKKYKQYLCIYIKFVKLIFFQKGLYKNINNNLYYVNEMICNCNFFFKKMIF